MISIHDLTRRSTNRFIRIVKECAFQFTTSQGGRLWSLHVSSSLQIFQFTTSQGGRLKRLYECNDGRNISIHDLTRRSTAQADASCWFTTFQFTTSQGGRHLQNLFWFLADFISIHDLTRRSTKTYNLVIIYNQYFNSRPHKEVDRNHPSIMNLIAYISIHDLTRRSTVSWTIKTITYYIFQFTTSQGGRRVTKCSVN